MKGKRLLAGLMAALMCFGTAPAMTGIAAEGTQDSSSVVATVDSHYSVIIPKSLVMSVDTATWHGAADYQATVIGDIEMGKSVYVVPQARFDMTKEDGSAIVNTAVSQTKTEWPSADVKAAQEDAIWGDGSLSGGGFQPGDWSGVFYFNIAADDSGLNIEAPGDKVISADLKDGDVADAGTFQLGQGQSGSIQLMMDGQDVTRLATYESDNERITVSDQGVVNTDNANGGDEATITATYYTQTAAAAEGVGTNVVKAYFKVQVIGIAFDKETVTARPGDTVEVTASVLPDSVDGTVKWMLNGLDFGYEGNTITINVAEDAQPGNYALVAMYGGTTETLNIKVSAGPAASGIVDGGEYTGSVTVTVGEGNTVTVDGNPVELDSENRFTVDSEGEHIIVVSGVDGSSVTYNITIVHQHNYVDGICSVCGAGNPDLYSDPGLYTMSGKKLLTWNELTLDHDFNPENDYTLDTAPLKTITTDTNVNPSSANCVLVLPDITTRIGNYACYGAEKIRLVMAPNVTQYGAYALAGTSITNFDFSKMTSIPNGLLANCPNLKSITIPDTVSEIGSNTFSNSGITELILPCNITKIPYSMVSGCSNLKSITIPGTVTDIGSFAFSESGITELTIPCNVTEIGSNIVTNCNSLNTLIVEGDTELSYTSLTGNGNTRLISYRPISSYSFPDFNGYSAVYLKKLHVTSGNNAYINNAANTDLNCLLIDEIQSANNNYYINAFKNYKYLYVLGIPDGITSLSSNAFSDGYVNSPSSMQRVYIPESCTFISASSQRSGPFYGHEYISIYYEGKTIPSGFGQYYDGRMVINNSLDRAYTYKNKSRSEFNSTANGNYFGGKINFALDAGHVLTTVSKEDPTCTVDGCINGVCERCGVQKTIPIPATGHNFPVSPTSEQIVIEKPATCSETGIERKVCSSCGELSDAISIPKLEHIYGNEETVDPTCESEGYTGKSCQVCGHVVSDSKVPALGHDYDIDTNICNRCGASADDSIIYDGTHVTGYRDTGYCPVIHIKNGTTHIDENALKNIKCGKIILPDSIEYLGKYALQSLYICEVTVPDSVNTVVDNAFFNVGTVMYTGSLDTSKWGAWSINGYCDGDFVYMSADKAYLVKVSPNKDGLIVIPDSVTEIRKNAISNNPNVEYIVVGNGCATIGSQAFGYNSVLKSIWLPSSVKTVYCDDNAFRGIVACSYNATVYCEPTSVNYPADWNKISSSSSAPVICNTSREDYMKQIAQ